MCDSKIRPQTVTGRAVDYTENSPAQVASILEAESLLLEAIGKGFTENNDKKARQGFYVLCASLW